MAKSPAWALAIALFALAFAPSASGAEFFLAGAGIASTENPRPFSVDLSGGIEHHADDFDIKWELGFSTDGRYPAPFMGDFFGDFSVDVRQAGLGYKFGNLALSLGKLPITDVVDSPYSLFASGAKNAAMTAQMVYDDSRIYFSNRWIGLNYNLDDGTYFSLDPAIYDDRGAALKTYAVRFGRLRVGFQDAAVFTGSYFDIDFFANLAPTIFVQYVATAAGRPWSRTGDQNAILGFFADYEGEGWNAYAQVLVDDFNMNRFLNPDGSQNPDKLAFSAGGTWAAPIGRLGFYAAAATKYAFESIGGRYYSYTYYPGSAVDYGGIVEVPIEENMIGYRHGENNLALMSTWAGAVRDLDVSASAEFTLSGSKSPCNPWHEYANWREGGEGLRFLDEEVLEKRLVVGFRSSAEFGVLTLIVGGKLGYAANRLKAVNVPDDNGDLTGNAEPIFKPSDESGPVFEISIGGRLTLGM